MARRSRQNDDQPDMGEDSRSQEHADAVLPSDDQDPEAPEPNLDDRGLSDADADPKDGGVDNMANDSGVGVEDEVAASVVADGGTVTDTPSESLDPDVLKSLNGDDD